MSLHVVKSTLSLSRQCAHTHTHTQISLRPVCLQDFIKALARSHKTVSEDDLFKYEQFTIKYGQAG